MAPDHISEYGELAAQAAAASSLETEIERSIATLHIPRLQLQVPKAESGGAAVASGIFSAIAERPITVLDLGAPTAEALAAATRLGLSLRLLQLIGNDDIGSGTSESSLPILTPDEIAVEEAIRRYTGFSRRQYQSPFFSAHGLVTIDPMTGGRLVSTHSFPLEKWHIAYRF